MTGDPGSRDDGGLRIALPLAGGVLAQHFGDCEEFIILTADDGKVLDGGERVAAPAHQPGLLPGWLGGLGVDVVIAGGMGNRARAMFSEAGIRVVVGAAGRDPQGIAQSFLDGRLEEGKNLCDH